MLLQIDKFMEEEQLSQATTETPDQIGGSKVAFIIVIFGLIIATGSIGYYIMQQQKFLDEEIARFVISDQDRMERKSIRSISSDKETIENEDDLTWGELIAEKTISISYPQSWNALSYPGDLPAQTFTALFDELIILDEEQTIFTDPKVLIEQQVLVDEYVLDAALLDSLLEPKLDDINNVNGSAYTTSSGLTYLHLTGEAKEAAELDQPVDLYALLFEDGAENLTLLVVSSQFSVDEFDGNSLQSIVDRITLLPGMKQVSLNEGDLGDTE